MTSLLVDGQGIAEVEVGQVTGHPMVGKRRVQLELKFGSARWNGKSDLLLFDLCLDATLSATRGSQQLPLGRFVLQCPANVLHLNPGSQPVPANTYLVLDVDPRQMEAMDDLRSGGDIQIRFDVRGRTFSPTAGVRDAHAQLHHVVERATWLRVMEQSGHRATLLVEVPLRAEGEVSAVSRHLQAAEAHFRLDQYTDSVADCRKALEKLSDLSEAKDTRAKLKQALDDKDKAEAMSLDERFLALRHALKHVCNPAHHADGHSESIKYGREDARAVLLATSALVNRYST